MVDEEGFPCILASSLKGALRAIVKEDTSREALEITNWYQELLTKEYQENEEQVQKLFSEELDVLERIEKRYEKAIKNASACDLFGIREFNNTPKLLFNDLRVEDGYRDREKCFSIDTKTSIDCNGTEPKSNPRTYKTVRKGVEFEGEIEFYGFGRSGFDENIIRGYIIFNLEKFNEGIYRLGGSKSRGYGKIHVSVIEDGGENGEKL